MNYSFLRDWMALRGNPLYSDKKWLITGVAGFIGSHLLEALLTLDQEVVGLDNFSSGTQANLEEVRNTVTPEQWARFSFIKGDIRETSDCLAAVVGVEHLLHQAALVSVPASLENPLLCHAVNVNGFLNLLVAARDAGVKTVVYASSSAVYGDAKRLPNVEPDIGTPLSPYAATKRIDEIYASLFAQTYGLRAVGLRYFNVFGQRQNPTGPYASVIPRWIQACLTDGTPMVYGDGTATRDFCHVANVVTANLSASLQTAALQHEVFNIASGTTVNLLELRGLIIKHLMRVAPKLKIPPFNFLPPRKGDIRHSSADISQAASGLGYEPVMTLDQGIAMTAKWYASSLLAV